MLFNKLIFLTELMRQWQRMGEGLLELGKLAPPRQGNYTEVSRGESLLRKPGGKWRAAGSRKCAAPYWRSVCLFLSPVASSNILCFFKLLLCKWEDQTFQIKPINFSALLTWNPASFLPPLPGAALTCMRALSHSPFAEFDLVDLSPEGGFTQRSVPTPCLSSLPLH